MLATREGKAGCYWCPVTCRHYHTMPVDYAPDGYLDKVPSDSWKNNYIYISPGVHNKDFDLVSYGKDGESGGTEYDADIESWNLDE